MAGLTLSLNRTCAPDVSLAQFLMLAKDVGAAAVELRNDMGEELAGLSPTRLRARLAGEGLRLASLNALQRFNAWTPDRADEARRLVDLARDLGAPGIVLCPAIDPDDLWDDAAASDRLREALHALTPIFAGSGVAGLVEPLGMRGSSLRFQSDAVAAVEATGGWQVFQLCHDSFQFYRCGDAQMYPEHFGIVHVSGIVRDDLAPSDLTEPDRGLVFAGERTNVVDQLRQIRAAGYDGPISMEPFDPAVQNDPSLHARLRASLDYIRATVT
jgi:2-keto-myo-inositol isomerase